MIVRGVFCHLSFLLILLRLTPGHALTCYDCRGSVSSSHTFTCILIRFLRAADLDETFSNWLHLPQFCIGDHCFLKTINWAKSESAQIQIILHILHCIALKCVTTFLCWDVNPCKSENLFSFVCCWASSRLELELCEAWQAIFLRAQEFSKLLCTDLWTNKQVDSCIKFETLCSKWWKSILWILNI